jgi:hypothetical protein
MRNLIWVPFVLVVTGLVLFSWSMGSAWHDRRDRCAEQGGVFADNRCIEGKEIKL